jgi:hypothetical protein
MAFRDPLGPSLAARIIWRTSSGLKYSDPPFRNRISWRLVVSFRPRPLGLSLVSQLGRSRPYRTGIRPPLLCLLLQGPGTLGAGRLQQLSSPGTGKMTPLLPDVRQLLQPPAAVPKPRWSAASVSPCGGSLLLRHVGFPCPHVFSRLPSAGCIGLPLLGCLRCFEQIGSVGFPLPSFPGSFDVFRLSGQWCACTAALHPPVLPRSYLAAGVSLHLPTPGHLYSDLAARS